MLVSGKGGVGKTTVAAATAAGAATHGHRTLAISLNRAHNLGGVLETALGPEPVAVEGQPGLFALEADPQAELERQWRVLSRYFTRFLAWAGVGGAEAAEVAVLPGLEELLVLTRLVDVVESGDYDVVVVDLAPTASSLRMLSFPELLTGPLGRLLSLERSVMRFARPAMKRMTQAPLPEDEVYDAIENIAGQLQRLRELLVDPARTVVRLVAVPERIVIDESKSAYALLSLFGLCVDCLVLNRVLPDGAAVGWFESWGRVQKRERARAEQELAGLELRELAFQKDEVSGVRALARCAREIYGARDPAAPFSSEAPARFSDVDGAPQLELHIPSTERSDVNLLARPDALIITVGGWRRQLPLPASLQGRAVERARFVDDKLVVHFTQEET